MKVAFVSQPWEDVIPPVQGHALSIWTYQVTQRLTGRCAFIVYARHGRSQQKVQWYNNIQYRRIPVSFEDQSVKAFKLLERLFGHPRPQRPFFSLPIYYLGYILQIAIDLRKQKCDIVHIWNFSQFVPIIRALNPNVKIVLHMQCEWLTQLDPKMIEKRLSQVELIIGCTEYITHKIRRRFPQFANRCQTIFNGVDINIFTEGPSQESSKKDDLKRLLFIGRVSPEKGLHVLLEAFQKVVKSYPQVELNIIGPVGAAPYEFIILVSQDKKVANLASFYDRLGLKGHGAYLTALQAQIPPELRQKVHFLGPVSHPDLPDYYRNADAFIFPSVWDEPFGIPLVEAMACQTPVIATKSGGMPEIIQHGNTGLVVERGNAQDLADAILQLLQNPDLSLAMGQAGQKRALKHFSWDLIAQDLFAQYKVLNKCQENLGIVCSS